MNATLPKTKKEAIDTVADLRVGDEITIEGRSKPLVVQRVKVRSVETPDGTRLTQHGAEVEGDWQNANTYVLADGVNPFTGEYTGRITFFDDWPRGVPRGFEVRRLEDTA